LRGVANRPIRDPNVLAELETTPEVALKKLVVHVWKVYI